MSSPVTLSKMIPAPLVSVAALAVPVLVWAATSLPFPFSALASLLALGAAYLAGKPITPPRWAAGKAVLPAVLVPLAGTMSAALFSYSLTLSGLPMLGCLAGAVVLAALAGLSEPAPMLATPVPVAVPRGTVTGLGTGPLVESVTYTTDPTPTTNADPECSLGQAGQGKCQ